MNTLHMRLRTVLIGFVALNLAWASGVLLFPRRAAVVAQVPPVRPVAAKSAATLALVKTNATSATVLSPTNPPAAIAALETNVTSRPETPVAHSPNEIKIPPVGKKFTGADVQSDEYLTYIANLRTVGCPEARLRQIIISDVNELIDKKRLDEAVAGDPQWWRAETYLGSLGGVIPQTVGLSQFDGERRELFKKLLGADWEQTVKIPVLTGGVRLGGPVLGALATEKYNDAQEICSRSINRHQSYFMSQINAGQTMDQVELAKMRNQTRTDLAKIFAPEEMEEFLLRYSHNSQQLRQNLRGFDPTPDEFRKIFRATDAIDHRLQLEYGGPEALSAKQREEYEMQRDRAVQELLPAARYEAYLQTKDPLYRQAQLVAQQYGLNARAVPSLHQLNRSQQSRQLEITKNAALTAEQKTQALQALMQEHQQAMQRILTDSTYRR